MSSTGVPKVVYRGLASDFEPQRQNSQPITWVTPVLAYAQEYAYTANPDEHACLLTLDIHLKRGFSFGFRTLDVEVKLSEIVSRVRRGVMELYELDLLTDDMAMRLLDRLSELHSEGYKRAWQWYMDTPELSYVLVEAGYSHIVASEGRGNDISTYGILDKSCITNTSVSTIAKAVKDNQLSIATPKP